MANIKGESLPPNGSDFHDPDTEVLLLGFVVPDALASELFDKDPSPAIQTHRFGWSLARSLALAFGQAKVLSAAPVQSFPLTPKVVYRGFSFSSGAIDGLVVGFLNLVVAKHITRLMSYIYHVPRVVHVWRIKYVIVHGVHSANLVFAWILTFFGVRFITVITDPSGVALPTDSFLHRGLKCLDRRIVSILVSRSSAIVALSSNLIPPRWSKPVLLMPGIVNSDWLRAIAEAGDQNARDRLTVLYAGSMTKSYGVDRLLEAASLLPEVDFILCGKGELALGLSKELAMNVRYVGFVNTADLARLCARCDLLINPRPTDTDISEASFPSKLLEYAASGRPVLTTRISSIPSSIQRAYHYIDDESPQGIAQSIRVIGKLSRRSRHSDALLARALVLSSWSESAVAERLVNLIGECKSP